MDLLPVDWWQPGNLHMLGPMTWHFCSGDGVRTIEVNGRQVAAGAKPFPFGRWDEAPTGDDADANGAP